MDHRSNDYEAAFADAGFNVEVIGKERARGLNANLLGVKPSA